MTSLFWFRLDQRATELRSKRARPLAQRRTAARARLRAAALLGPPHGRPATHGMQVQTRSGRATARIPFRTHTADGFRTAEIARPRGVWTGRASRASAHHSDAVVRTRPRPAWLARPRPVRTWQWYYCNSALLKYFVPGYDRMQRLSVYINAKTGTATLRACSPNAHHVGARARAGPCSAASRQRSRRAPLSVPRCRGAFARRA